MNWNPNEKDPWGRKNNNPPDLDDAIEQLRKMFFQMRVSSSKQRGDQREMAEGL